MAAEAQQEVRLCKRGHPRTPENVDASRHCKMCERERGRRRRLDPEYREKHRQHDSAWYRSDNPSARLSIMQSKVKFAVKRRLRKIEALRNG